MKSKKIIILLVVLMFIMPSFAFAAESDSFGSGSDTSSVSQINLENSERGNSDHSGSASESERVEDSNLFDPPQNMEEGMDSEMMGVTSAGVPGIDTSSLTALDGPSFSFTNDAYLTSLFTGAAVYVFPIYVPRGINGFQPRVTLTYNSQSVGGQYGWLGDGWSLNEFYILRDVNFTPNDISNHRFRLIFNGQSHRLIYNPESGFYHTEIETYLRIQRLQGGTNQKGEYWLVTTRDGVQYRFGYTEDSELVNSVVGRNYVSKWKLDQIEDLNGNLIIYNYVQNPVAGERGTSYLSTIVYNNGFNKIEFVRIGKANQFSGYFHGNFVVEKSLLSSIRIWEQDSVIFTYNLIYRNNRGHQTIGSIRVTGTDGNVQNSITTRFSYFNAPTPGNLNFARQSRTVNQNTYPAIYVSSTNPTLRFMPIDLNGDGRMDLVRSHPSGTNVIYEIWINNGNGFTQRTGTINQNSFPAIHVSNTDFTQRFVQIDLNGNGRMDLVRSHQSGTNVIYEKWINNGDGSFTRQTGTVNQNVFPALHVSNTNFTPRFLQIDLNGNGLRDFVRSHQSGNNVIYEIWINNGDGFTRQTGTVSQGTFPAVHVSNTVFTLRYHPIDLNGDGLTDLMRSYPSGTNVNFSNWINNGDGFTRQTGTVNQNSFPAIHVSATNFTMRYMQMDLNGDRLPDFIRSYQSGNNVNFRNWINNGNGFTLHTGTSARDRYPPIFTGPTTFTPQYLQIDLNGNGFPDLMRSYQSGTNVVHENWINRASGSANFEPANLLSRINHPFGASTRIEYAASTRFDNTKADGIQGLPTSITIVSRVHIDSGASFWNWSSWSGFHHTVSTFTYEYTGGFMHIEPGGKTEFRGFRQVTVNDGRSTTVHHFHQDQARKGNEYKTVIKSNTGEIFSITENEFTVNVSEFNQINPRTNSALRFESMSIPLDLTANDMTFEEELSVFNQTDMYFSSSEINFDRMSNEFVYNENAESMHIENVNSLSTGSHSKSGSFVNIEDITIPLGKEGYILQELSLTNLRVSTGARDVAFIHLNDREILRFVDNAAGGTLHVFNEQGATLGLIHRINGKPTFENILFNIRFVQVGSEMQIFIERTDPRRGTVTNYNFRYAAADESITTFRAHMIGFQSGVDFITGNYEAIYVSRDVVNGTNSVFEVLLTSSTHSLYDGQATPIVSKTIFEYDSFGNPTRIHSLGDLSVTGDERTVLFEYTYNIDDWILNRVSKETLLGPTGQRVAETRFYYDGSSNLNTAPTRGLITRAVHWNSHGADIVNDFKYDSFGNLIAQFDGEGHLTTIEYGENPVFPISFTNALGQTTLLEYDTRIGRLTQITDPNGFVTSMEYDHFGRITKVIQPGDSSESPTIWYHYMQIFCCCHYQQSIFLPVSLDLMYLWSGHYNFIMIRVKEDHNQYLDTWKFYDGLGRVIRIYSESTDASENIIQKTYYNNFGEIETIVAPRKSFEPFLNTTFSYDAFGRLIQITNPDGTTQRIEYEQLTTTFFDARGNPFQTVKDVFGNIIIVREFNHGDIYETRYMYDAANNLIRIIPHQSYDQTMISFLIANEGEAINGLENTTWFEMRLDKLVDDTSYKVANISFVYDSLGRLVLLDDPNLGIWRFEYNANGRLISQTDSRGITIHYEYDPLNRITRIIYPNDDDVFFEYDIGTIGTLSRVTTGMMTRSYLYDERLRVIEQKVTIKGFEDLFGSMSAVGSFDVEIQSLTNSAIENSADISDALQLEESVTEWPMPETNSNANLGTRFESKAEADFRVYDAAFEEGLSAFNTTDAALSTHTSQEIDLSHMSMESAHVVSSVSSQSFGSSSKSGSFVNIEDITIPFEKEGYILQELSLTDLRVSMGARDIAYIYLNDREILRFVDTSAGGTLHVFNEQGETLGLIHRINGKHNFENITFNIRFVQVGSEMQIFIVRMDNRFGTITNHNFSYITADKSITTFRAHMFGFQSGIDFITGNYEALFIPISDLPPEETIRTFENKESILIHNSGSYIEKLALTDFRVLMGIYDSASVFLNNYEVLRFTDSPTGGTLQILDEVGNELDLISQVNGNPLYENVSFNILFDNTDSSLIVSVEKMKGGNVIDERSYVIDYEMPIIFSHIHIFGYQYGVNYISGQFNAPLKLDNLILTGSFVNAESVTIPLKTENLVASEFTLKNFKALYSSGNQIHILINNHRVMGFVEGNAGRLNLYRENGQWHSFILITHWRSPWWATLDMNFINTDSGVSMEIEHFHQGQSRGITYHTFNISGELEEMRISMIGYQSGVDFISGEYMVRYVKADTDMIFPEKPDIPSNMFQNEGEILVEFETLGRHVNELNLTDFRAIPVENSNISIYLNDLEMVRFSESNSGTIDIFDANRSLFDTLSNINSNVSYGNMTFNVLFTADLSVLNIDIEKMERGELTNTFSHSFAFNESISNMRIKVENYQSEVSFMSGDISASLAGLPEAPFDPREFGPDFITTFRYDSMNRIVQKTLPDGRIVDYIYNNRGLLVAIPGVINNIEYNSLGQITRTEFANGVTTDLTYDRLTTRLANINTPGLQNMDYFFDERGNIIGITDHIVGEHQYFFYDDLNRLLLAGSESYMQSFAFNPLGSILAHRSVDLRTGEEIIFGFEFGNGAGIHAPTRVGNMHLFYDANGNLVEDGNFIFIYNDANRLVQVLKKADNNRVIAEFAYDESGRRIMKMENGVTTLYINRYFDVTDGVATSYFFANGQRVARDSADGRFWFLTDHLGSTNVVVDSNGELVERTLYYPFGAHRMGGEERYTFTGKEFDTGIGLFYFEARFYNPMTFVFTQPDPIIPGFFNPQALNRYAYCFNNPIKYVDPDGHVPMLKLAVAGALIGGGWEAFNQYRAHGQITDGGAILKAAGSGAVKGGLIGLTGGAGKAIVKGAPGAANRAAAVGIDSAIGAGTNVIHGIGHRSAMEALGGGNVQSTLHAGLNPDAMFNDGIVGAVPIPGGTGVKTVVSVSLPHTNIGNQIKSTSVMGTMNSGATAFGNAVQSGAQSTVNTIQSGVSSVTNTVNSGMNSVTNTVSSGVNSVTNTVNSGINSVTNAVNSLFRR